MNRIVINAVSKDAMRAPYNATGYGDWLYNAEGDLEIRVVSEDLATDREGFLVAFHELTEAMLCRYRGISQEAVDRFDREFEVVREKFLMGGDEAEPGDDPQSPYVREHRFACLLEFMLAHEMGMSDYGTVR